MGVFTVGTSRCGVPWLLAFVGHVLLTTFHSSWGVVAVIFVVSDLLTTPILGDEVLSLLGSASINTGSNFIKLKILLFLSVFVSCTRINSKLTPVPFIFLCILATENTSIPMSVRFCLTSSPGRNYGNVAEYCPQCLVSRWLSPSPILVEWMYIPMTMDCGPRQWSE